MISRLKQKVKPILSNLFPKIWEKQFKETGQEIDVLEFNNLSHFKQYLKKIKIRPDGAANNNAVNFETALEDLIKGKSVLNSTQFDTIKNEVKSTLHKRGLISENIYEGYEYDIEGEYVDIAEYINGNTACMLKPKTKYKNYFYELFISAAYLGNVSEQTIIENAAKILATVQLLEQEHIYIKITLVAASSDTVSGKRGLVVAIPLFSHKDEKTIETMSSIINERLFRTFIFGIREDYYGEKLNSGYGCTIDLEECLLLRDVNVESLAQNILDATIVASPSR